MPLPTGVEGKWKLEKSEKFDEYLSAKSVPWLVRKIILASSMTRSFEADKEGDGFTHTVTTPRFTVSTHFPALGTAQEMKQMDGKMAQVSYTVEGGTLHEAVEYADGAKDAKTYAVEDGRLLNVFKDDAKGIECKQFFKSN